jgi:hypothetical protein
VVHVDKVIKSTKVMAGHAGRDVTVILAQGPDAGLKEGQKAVFYTEGVVYGEHLAVREVAPAHLEGAAAAPASKPALTQAATKAVESVAKQADDALKVHLASADAVVFGTVRAVQPVDHQRLMQALGAGQPKPRRISEHDPDYRIATVDVGSVEKGATGQTQVQVVFANSGDVMWRSSPKFRPNEQGTIVLHKRQIRNPAVRSLLMTPAPNGPEVYSALNPMDWHPHLPNNANLNRIRRLLGKE